MYSLKLICNFIVLFVTVSAQQTCNTPNQSRGLCVPYSQCSYVWDYLQRYGENLPYGIRDYFKKSKCEGSTAEVHVCCDTVYVTGEVTTSSAPVHFATSAPTRTTNAISNPTSSSIIDYESTLNIQGVEILKNTVCGVGGKPRIRGGVKVKIQEFPWMALLQYDTEDTPFKCGGSLITNRFVLTAAHCMVNLPYELIGVRLGEHNLDTEVDCDPAGDEYICNPPVENFGISEKLSHPEYSKAYMINDVALIKLDRVASFTKHIKPICLPITQRSIEFLTTQRYFIAGWGTTEHGSASTVLLKAVVPYKEPQVCQNIYKHRIRITEKHICAGGENQTDTCKGDSGGPLFFPASYMGTSRYVQFGIVSFGAAGCSGQATYPGVYAYVPQLMPWITSNIIE